jgi:uncharacterized membrane protein YhhN
MPLAAILVPAVLLLAGLLRFASRRSFRGVLLTKSSLSALFVLAALTGPAGRPLYFSLILAGLICCVAGDVLLVFPARRFFLAGLFAFLAGHVLYGTAFFTTAAPGPQTVWAAALSVPASAAAFFWLRPYLGKMRLPVLIYVVIITLMVIGAATLAGEAGSGTAGRRLALAGAVLFYLSDLFVARNRFVKEEFGNRLLGLPLYYAGQFMIAFSVRFL